MSDMLLTERLAEKTPEASLLHILQHEFDLSLREAQEVVLTARAVLGWDQPAAVVRPGQVQVVVASATAPFGPPLPDTQRVTVTLTVDAGAEDLAVLAQQGRVSLRQGRILRLLEEAVDQGGVLTEEDLARVLHVTRRTIERDVQALRAAGHTLPTRGQLKGVGRGQTHKVKIITLWLDRTGYDKIAQWVHHSPLSIKRYVQAFLRIVALHQQGTVPAEIAFLVGVSPKLVQDYLAVYAEVQTQPHRLTKLTEELTRVCGLDHRPGKKGTPT